MTSLLDIIDADRPKPARECTVSMSGAHVLYVKDGVNRCVLCALEVRSAPLAPCS